jgi:hypothetical protein
MSKFDQDKLVEKVNAAIVKSDFKSAKRVRLTILLRRYLGGERTEHLFKAMKTETKDPAISVEATKIKSEQLESGV